MQVLQSKQVNFYSRVANLYAALSNMGSIKILTLTYLIPRHLRY